MKSKFIYNYILIIIDIQLSIKLKICTMRNMKFCTVLHTWIVWIFCIDYVRCLLSPKLGWGLGRVRLMSCID